MRRHTFIRVSTFVAWFVAAFVAGSAWAQAPAQAPAPQPEALAAARELIQVAKMADTFKTVMPTILRGMKPMIAQGRPEVERDIDTLIPILLQGMESRTDEMIDSIATVYANNFTAAEINEITAFFRSTTGQKFVSRQAAIMQESFAVGQAWGQKVAAELQSRMVEELRKKGYDLGPKAP